MGEDMRIFTSESLREYYVLDQELFEEITGLDLDGIQGLITLSTEQIIKLIEHKAIRDEALPYSARLMNTD